MNNLNVFFTFKMLFSLKLILERFNNSFVQKFVKRFVKMIT